MESIISRVRSLVRLDTVSSLQLFQLTRYSSFVLIGICFAKLGISKSDIGTFESFLWLMGLFSFFWIAGLMNSMLSVYPTRSESDKKQLLFTTFCLILLLSSVAGIIQLFIGGSMLGLAYLLFNNAAYVVEYILFLNDRRRHLLVYGISIAIIQVLLCVLPAYFSGDIHYAIYGLLAVALTKFIYISFLLRRYTITTIYIDKIKQLFLLALPLMLSFFVNGSAEYIDGAVIKHYFTLADFSVFRYGSRDFPLFTILAATLSMSMIPRVAADLSDGLQAIKTKALTYMHGFFPVAILLILLSKWLFVSFFSDQFIDSGRVFALLMLLTIPRLLFPQTILTALKENKLILLSAIFEMLINIIASVALAQHFGILGVAWGTVIAFIAEKLLMILLLYYKYQISPSAYIPLLPFAVYSLLLVASYGLSLFL